jgi:hypothetical protein
MNEALKQLTEMKQASLAADHPAVPGHAIPKASYSDRTANGLTRCIIDWIRLNGGHAERVANTGRLIGTGRRRRWIPGTGTNGTADVHAVKGGRFVAIEVKVGRDRQSRVQQQYQAAVTVTGGAYIIATSFQNFVQLWEQL